MTLAIIAWATLLLVVLFRRLFGIPSSFTLLQYQRGILYRRGIPAREVGPGRHTVWVGIEKILFIDARPISVSVENRAVTLSDGSTAIYGFSGSAEVDDVRKALYSAGNYTEMPAFVMLCCARLVLNAQSGIGLMPGQAAIVDAIVRRATPRLSEAGFRLVNFRITQLTIASGVSAQN